MLLAYFYIDARFLPNLKKTPTDSLSNKIFHKYSICMTPVKLHKIVKFNLTSTSKGTTYNKTEIKVKFDQLLKC